MATGLTNRAGGAHHYLEELIDVVDEDEVEEMSNQQIIIYSLALIINKLLLKGHSVMVPELLRRVGTHRKKNNYDV